jgi:hypothetical protein
MFDTGYATLVTLDIAVQSLGNSQLEIMNRDLLDLPLLLSFYFFTNRACAKHN